MCSEGVLRVCVFSQRCFFFTEVFFFKEGFFQGVFFFSEREVFFQRGEGSLLFQREESFFFQRGGVFSGRFFFLREVCFEERDVCFQERVFFVGVEFSESSKKIFGEVFRKMLKNVSVL